ncbi:MAG: hypothetical protein AB1758_21990 [Candidatus Eremiobacterota bacterium]
MNLSHRLAPDVEVVRMSGVGPILVEPGPELEVQLTGTAQGLAALPPPEERPGLVRVAPCPTTWTPRQAILRVPAGTTLRLEASAPYVRVNGVENLSLVNRTGNIVLRGIRGGATVAAPNGSVTLREVARAQVLRAASLIARDVGLLQVDRLQGVADVGSVLDFRLTRASEVHLSDVEQARLLRVDGKLGARNATMVELGYVGAALQCEGCGAISLDCAACGPIRLVDTGYFVASAVNDLSMVGGRARVGVVTGELVLHRVHAEVGQVRGRLRAFGCEGSVGPTRLTGERPAIQDSPALQRAG